MNPLSSTDRTESVQSDASDTGASSSTPLLIHVGFAKCASSWLQARLFLREHGFVEPWPNRENRIIEDLVLPRARRFDAQGIRQRFQESLAQQSLVEGEIPIITSEVLVGDPILGVFHGDETARRLHTSFPEARILMCIREQASMILSCWGEYVRRGGLQNLSGYAGFGERRQGYTPILRRDFLEYDLTYQTYAQYFGESNVLCLAMEELTHSPDRFLARLMAFLNRPIPKGLDTGPVYQGLGFVALHALRRLNTLALRDPLGAEHRRRHRLISLVRKLDRRIPRSWNRRIRSKMVHRIVQAVGDEYLSSNDRTARLCDIPLQDWKYRCGTPSDEVEVHQHSAAAAEIGAPVR